MRMHGAVDRYTLRMGDDSPHHSQSYTIQPAGGLALKASLEIHDGDDQLVGVWRRWEPANARWGLRMTDLAGDIADEPSLCLRPRIFGAGRARIELERPDGLPAGQFVLSRLSGPYAEHWTLTDAMAEPIAALVPSGGATVRVLGALGLLALIPAMAPDLHLRVGPERRAVAKLRIATRTVRIEILGSSDQLSLEEVLAFGCVLLRNTM